MSPSLRKNAQNLLKNYRLRPSKRLGQNFLIDKGMLKKVISAADLKPEDTVLEIGPGLGALTQELAKKAGKVIAVEKDPNMVNILKETLGDFDNVEIVQGDIRKFNLQTLKFDKVVGNLPFYLTALVIRQFLEDTRVEPVYMVLVVQKEVGQRICVKPPRMSLLAVSVQFYAKPEIIAYVSKNSFWPRPKVDAAIIKITPHSVPTPDVGTFFKIVRAGFSQPRKQLINNLSKGLKIDKEKTAAWLLQNNIQPSQRAETLTIQNWMELTNSFVSNNIETRPFIVLKNREYD